MTTAVATKPSLELGKMEQVLLKGDLSVLTESERTAYYRKVCETLGLNPITKPFEYINLSGKLVLYSTKGCAEQLRQIHNISLRITDRKTIESVYVVTAAASTPDGRIDESTGAVQISGLKGDALANAMMKAETKAKRRVTLSICGLNMLDETEVETVTPKPPIKAVENTAEPTTDKKPAPIATVVKQFSGPSQAQLKRLWAIKKAAKWSDEQVKEYISKHFNLKSSTGMNREQYQEICSFIEANPVVETNEPGTEG